MWKKGLLPEPGSPKIAPIKEAVTPFLTNIPPFVLKETEKAEARGLRS
jgi:hypothetical protein